MWLCAYRHYSTNRIVSPTSRIECPVGQTDLPQEMSLADSNVARGNIQTARGGSVEPVQLGCAETGLGGTGRHLRLPANRVSERCDWPEAASANETGGQHSLIAGRKEQTTVIIDCR